MTAAVWLLSSLIPLSAWAQTREAPPVPPGPLTLDQVLSLAEPRSEAVSIATAGVQRAEADEIRARSGLRPQLSASASYDRALASEFDGVFDSEHHGRPVARRSHSTRRRGSTRVWLKSSGRSTAVPSAAAGSSDRPAAADSRICRSAGRTPGVRRSRFLRTSTRAVATARRSRWRRLDTSRRSWA